MDTNIEVRTRTAVMDEVQFDSLGLSDEITIHTGSNKYTFVVTDSVELGGVLMGGYLGNEFQQAVLLGAVGSNSQRVSADCKSLSVGARAFFFLPVVDKTFVTAAITNIDRAKTTAEVGLSGSTGTGSK